MCGIIGRINYSEPVNMTVFTEMRDTLIHRGPDDAGIYLNKSSRTALGHRRLALNDLSEKGRQPMTNEDKTVWLTCNGEIYNYLQLKSELENAGHRFYSNSDSEVIIHGYEEWGIDVLNKLKGMFAFGLWDETKQQLLLARDRFGIKPLYYYAADDTFIFASEIKGIIKDEKLSKQLDYTSFCDFFVYRYVPGTKTIWKEISKLPPAHYLLLTREGHKTTHRYWEIPTASKNIPKGEVIARIDELLSLSIKDHMLSNVPVGSFLSGGYDSSALVYYLSRAGYQPKTFSIGFENWDKSEHQYAETVAGIFNTDHTTTLLGKDSLDLVEKLAYYYDEPIADISIIPTYEVSRVASAQVKAVLSGEGADEIFGGYNWHRSYKQALANLSFTDKLKHKLGMMNGTLAVSKYGEAMSMGDFSKEVLSGLLHKDLKEHIPDNSLWFYQQHFNKGLSPVKTLQHLDINCFMSELVLTKVDRASMANSLEVRVPFLDHELVEYMFQLNESSYLIENVQKFALHENIKGALPSEILKRPKQGFVGPDSYYQDINWYKSYLLDGRLLTDGVLNRKVVEEWIASKDHWRLWKVLVMECWYQRWN